MSLASDARAIALAGIRAVRPDIAVRRVLMCRGPRIRVGTHALRVGPAGRVHLVAMGKAAGAMIDAAAAIVGRNALGLAIPPRGYPAPRSVLPVVYGEHPVPGPGSFRAGRLLLDYVRATDRSDAVLYLISGGGSAVAELPVPPLTRSDLSGTTERLLASGAPIGAMNAIRRHLSAIKGGRLALATTAPSRGTVAISDVVGDSPADIASGPTVADPSTFGDALKVVRRYRLSSRLPPKVLRHLRDGAAGRIPETPKSTERRLRGDAFVLAATNRTALSGAAQAARERGYRPQVLSSPLTGETQPVARRFATRLVRSIAPSRPRKVALLAGGETTVTLGPHPGRGGRNQEFAIAAARVLEGRGALVLSIGTDGIDGPTDAAGGWTDGGTAAMAGRQGIDLTEALRRHAAYDALEGLGRLVRTGPTGTNVMDLHVGLGVRGRGRSTAGSSPQSAAPSSRRRRS